jgi:hypothetical protein
MDRQFAYEAADIGLLSPELATGISDVQRIGRKGGREITNLPIGEASGFCFRHVANRKQSTPAPNLFRTGGGMNVVGVSSGMPSLDQSWPPQYIVRTIDQFTAPMRFDQKAIWGKCGCRTRVRRAPVLEDSGATITLMDAAFVRDSGVNAK